MSDTPDPKGPSDCPRLIFNSDGDSTTYIAFEPPITPEQACRDIEEVVGTAVEVFTNSMGRGDETFSHPTGFGEIYGSNVTEWPQAEGLEYVRWMADSTRALLDQGVNIIELLAARGHERGMQFWPALRMNDIHEDDTGRWRALSEHLQEGAPRAADRLALPEGVRVRRLPAGRPPAGSAAAWSASPRCTATPATTCCTRRLELLAPGGQLHLPVQLRLPPAAEDRQRRLHPGRGPVAARD